MTGRQNHLQGIFWDFYHTTEERKFGEGIHDEGEGTDLQIHV